MKDSPPSSTRHRIDRLLVRCLEAILIVLMAALVLDVLWGVLSRHILQSQSSWTEELARFLLVWVGLLGASLGFDKQIHLGLDYLAQKLHVSGRIILTVAAHFVVLFFAVAALIVGGVNLVQTTLGLGQVTPALGIPKGWVYLAVPVSGLFMAYFTLRNLAALLKDRNKEEETSSNENQPLNAES